MTDIRQRWLAPRWLFTIATVLGLIAAIELTAQRAVAPQFFDGGLWSAYLGSAGSWLPTNLLAFGALVGVTYASDFQDRYREQQLAASRLSAQLAQAELHALRMQLNPH